MIRESVVLPNPVPNRGTLGGFTPSDPLIPRRLERLNRNIARLAKAGLRVMLAPHALGIYGDVSGDPRARWDDISGLLTNPEVHALIATCGGKNTNALLSLASFPAFHSARKPIIGFSDSCVLLNAITAQTGMLTFYGPNVLSKLDESDYWDFRELTSIGECETQNRRSPESRTLYPGRVEGRLVGGNLSTFCVSIAGTHFEPQFADRIFFWESGTKEWRVIFQLLESLVIRGFISEIRGMIVGKIGDGALLSDVELKSLSEFSHRFNLPTIYMPIFGHGKAMNPIWPIGGLVRVDSEDAAIVMLEHFVE